MSEANLTRNLLRLIKSRGGYARKMHGGPVSAGLLDIVAVYRGYPVILEVKLPGRENTLTKLQAETIRQLKAAGAVTGVVTTRAQVERLLDAIDKKRGG